ncbi:MAG: hypothetical protein JWO89_3000 [Verrucomicrobiaceae bacterium]|nr:hypothetical protein [Verrucomicrobiaceae bacterium]
MTNIDWLATFLPMLRCPNTHEALRMATPEEKQRAGVAEGQEIVLNQSGSHHYSVTDGIPHLLPTSALMLDTSGHLVNIGA